jgi:hypothetical protein
VGRLGVGHHLPVASGSALTCAAQIASLSVSPPRECVVQLTVQAP